MSFKWNTTIFLNTKYFEWDSAQILKFWSTNLGGEWCYTANILLDVEGTEQVLVIVSNHMHVLSESEVHDEKGPEKGMGMGFQGI